MAAVSEESRRPCTIERSVEAAIAAPSGLTADIGGAATSATVVAALSDQTASARTGCTP